MRLDLPEDDLRRTAARDDLAGVRADDVEVVQRLRKLELVPRARILRQRPGHVGERDAKRVAGPWTGSARRDGSIGRAAGERERG